MVILKHGFLYVIIFLCITFVFYFYYQSISYASTNIPFAESKTNCCQFISTINAQTSTKSDGIGVNTLTTEPNSSILVLNVTISAKPIKESGIFLRLKNYIDEEVKKLKVYIPPANAFGPEFNTIFQNTSYNSCRHFDCFNYGHNFLRHVDNASNIGQFETDQFSTDLIIYNRIIHDKEILVNDINDSNVIFIPFMTGTACTKHNFEGVESSVYKDLYHQVALWIQDNKDAIKQKTLVLLYSRTERDYFLSKCQMYHKTKHIMDKYNVHVFGIENYKWRTMKYKFSAIPYASSAKFLHKRGLDRYSYPLNDERDVDALFTGNQKGNIFRQTIMGNIKIGTSHDYNEFKRENVHKFQNKSDPLSLKLDFGECDTARSLFKSNNWKLYTKFCYEPSGHTLTRRSFWDSIMFGCVPIVFKTLNLPFANKIDYKQFMLEFHWGHIEEIRENRIKLNDLLKPYLQDEVWLTNARNFIQEIRQFVQYSWIYDDNGTISDPYFRYDAYGMILARLASKL